MSEFFKAEEEKCELEGPYECPHCGGHLIVDATFLEQVSERITCPYCKKESNVPE